MGTRACVCTHEMDTSAPLHLHVRAHTHTHGCAYGPVYQCTHAHARMHLHVWIGMRTGVRDCWKTVHAKCKCSSPWYMSLHACVPSVSVVNLGSRQSSLSNRAGERLTASSSHDRTSKGCMVRNQREQVKSSHIMANYFTPPSSRKRDNVGSRVCPL